METETKSRGRRFAEKGIDLAINFGGLYIGGSIAEDFGGNKSKVLIAVSAGAGLAVSRYLQDYVRHLANSEIYARPRPVHLSAGLAGLAAFGAAAHYLFNLP